MVNFWEGLSPVAEMKSPKPGTICSSLLLLPPAQVTRHDTLGYTNKYNFIVYGGRSEGSFLRTFGQDSTDSVDRGQNLGSITSGSV